MVQIDLVDEILRCVVDDDLPVLGFDSAPPIEFSASIKLQLETV